MPRLKDLALCLRQFDWSESSQIVVLLTATRGLVRGLAKGSKRQSPSHRQRFSGGIELLTKGQILASLHPSHELATLIEWDLQDDYFHLRQNLPAQRLAMYAADVTVAMLGDHDPHPHLFTALDTFLHALAPNKEKSTKAHALLTFQWRLLLEAGFKPQLHEDVHTHQPLPDAPAYTFDPIAGGLTQRAASPDWRVRRATVAALRAVEANQPLHTLDDPTLTRANRLLCTYARAILDRQLPTMSLILNQGTRD